MSSTYSPKGSFESAQIPSLASQKPSAPLASSSSGGGFWSSLGKALTNDRGSSQDLNERNDRSTSRGRDFASAGRGGAGNMVRSESQSRAQVSRAEDGDERGRDIAPRDENKITHAGRGGQGNVRSPSRDPSKEAAERAFEEEVIRKNRENRETWGVSSGRGGTGNIASSRSRSREPKAAAGRGGLGNIVDHVLHPHHGDLERLDEEERAAQEAHHPHGVHSHGRGGQGNLSVEDAEIPHGTRVSADGTTHTGRGGQGNILV